MSTTFTDFNNFIDMWDEICRKNIKEHDALEQEPCEDAISRQAVKDKYRESLVNNLKDDNRGIDLSKYAEGPYKAFCEFIDSISPVKPQEPKIGHWITQWNLAHQKEYYYCSECREEYSYDGETGIKMNDYKYCPNCGARMKEGD